MWSIEAKSILATCYGHTSGVYAVTAMPDGQRILSGGNDNTVRVWLFDGTLKRTFEKMSTDYFGAVMCIAALPDGVHALYGSTDDHVTLFNVGSGLVLRRFSLPRTVSLTLLPDGLRFISCSADNTACIVYHGLAP